MLTNLKLATKLIGGFVIIGKAHGLKSGDHGYPLPDPDVRKTFPQRGDGLPSPGSAFTMRNAG